jgi:glycylpeptide N-tetradecanoyltransferase
LLQTKEQGYVSPHSLIPHRYKLYSLPEDTETPGFRAIHKKEIKKIYPQLKEYLSKFDVAMSFTKEEAVHYLSPRKNVIYSYVVEDPVTKEITDFISFYSLPSSVIGNDKHDKLNAAYSWYYFSEKTEVEDLFKDAIIMAKKEGFDVYNALNIMDNQDAFESLRFLRGAGSLHYYLFNYRLSNVESEKIAIVLV